MPDAPTTWSCAMCGVPHPRSKSYELRGVLSPLQVCSPGCVDALEIHIALSEGAFLYHRRKGGHKIEGASKPILNRLKELHRAKANYLTRHGKEPPFPYGVPQT